MLKVKKKLISNQSLHTILFFLLLGGWGVGWGAIQSPPPTSLYGCMYADDDERVIAVLGIFHEVRDGRIPSPKFGPALRILKRPIPSVLPCLAHTLVKISKKPPKNYLAFSK